MRDKQIKEMARLMDNCNDYKTCNQCIAASRAVGITENCDLMEYATKLYKAGYRKQGDTVREFSDKIRAAVDNITDTHSFTQPNLCVEVYVNKTAVLDCLIKLTNKYGVEVE